MAITNIVGSVKNWEKLGFVVGVSINHFWYWEKDTTILKYLKKNKIPFENNWNY